MTKNPRDRPNSQRDVKRSWDMNVRASYAIIAFIAFVAVDHALGLNLVRTRARALVVLAFSLIIIVFMTYWTFIGQRGYFRLFRAARHESARERSRHTTEGLDDDSGDHASDPWVDSEATRSGAVVGGVRVPGWFRAQCPGEPIWAARGFMGFNRYWYALLVLMPFVGCVLRLASSASGATRVWILALAGLALFGTTWLNWRWSGWEAVGDGWYVVSRRNGFPKVLWFDNIIAVEVQPGNRLTGPLIDVDTGGDSMLIPVGRRRRYQPLEVSLIDALTLRAGPNRKTVQRLRT